ncbi:MULTISPECIES: SsrA-binding protein SmpB [Sulfurospirillum]|uniref:SsrA-binding protein n=3 Tax=Sulfurospirillum TaxID=57665 RepID=A0A1D7TLC0_9BACT|nr:MULTISPECIES: SsrA-binding protein SmpB [Sulfurospirillum]AHJ13521.1 tmRNA-binding protein SmpB [Sulfurospirillum multivorans DSM 12446]AOO65781.1 tmRNA-binding protein SmpB [Sulfurospirillum halorespirans DSM 13726]QEH07011.1 tmRNA-binding protein SmpB [Sulfurospirillum multivorans]
MGEPVARNKKAFHDYEILERLEAGIVLQGSEVKAIRQSRVNLKDSFVKIIKGEAFLLNAHISHLSTANLNYAPNERAPRKLLLHMKQLRKWDMKVAKDGLTIVPLSIYFNGKNLAKVEIALARGKNEHDKRESLKEKDAQREAKTAIKNYAYKE